MINNKIRRLNKYHLDDFEYNFLNIDCEAVYNEPISEKKVKEKGILYLNTSSIIFESFIQNIPLIKIKFKRIQNLNDLKQNLDNSLKIISNEIIEIDTIPPLKPYIIHLYSKREINFNWDFSNYGKNEFIYWLNRIIYYYDKDQNLTIDYVSNLEPIEELLNEIYKNKFEKGYYFDKKNFISINEKLILEKTFLINKILPMVSIPGLFNISDKNIFFEEIHLNVKNKVERIQINSIKSIFKRRYNLKDIAIEIEYKEQDSTKNILIQFMNEDEKNLIYESLIKYIKVKDIIDEKSIEILMNKWQNKEISNKEYLDYLNLIGDRSKNDITQYPIFPWVITDFKLNYIDLKDPKIYRDLSKPIGALNPSRLKKFKERYNEMIQNQLPENQIFLYGTHYSTPGYVTDYLLRKKPELKLRLQSGKFDIADRLFYSVKNDWNNCYNNSAVVKELIPEFFENDTSFLINKKELDLGKRQNGKIVNNVKLPNWAKSYEEYLQINIQALESDYVSENLNNWIDLIFGYKQNGEEAITNDNLFHPFCYEGNIDLKKIDSCLERRAIKLQINDYGQVPKQLFKYPHPKRNKETIKKKISLEKLNFNDLSMENKIKIDETKEIKKDYIFRFNKFLNLKDVIVNDIVLNDEENILVICCEDGYIRIINIQNLVLEKCFKISDLSLSTIVYLKNGIYVIGCNDNYIYIFNEHYGYIIKKFLAHDDTIIKIISKFYENKFLLITNSKDCTIKLFQIELDNYEEIDTDNYLIEDNNYFFYYVNYIENDLIAAVDEENKIYFIDIFEKDIIKTINYNQKIMSIKYFQDDEILILFENQLIILNENYEEIINIHSENNSWWNILINKKKFVFFGNKGNFENYDYELKKFYDKINNNFHDEIKFLIIENNFNFIIGCDINANIYKCISDEIID